MSTDTQDHLVSLESTPLEVQAVVKIVGEAFNQFGRIGMTIGGKLGGRLVIIDCESGISPGLPANRIKDAASAILVKLVKLGAEMVAFWDEAWTVRSSSASRRLLTSWATS